MSLFFASSSLFSSTSFTFFSSNSVASCFDTSSKVSRTNHSGNEACLLSNDKATIRDVSSKISGKSALLPGGIVTFSGKIQCAVARHSSKDCKYEERLLACEVSKVSSISFSYIFEHSCIKPGNFENIESNLVVTNGLFSSKSTNNFNFKNARVNKRQHICFKVGTWHFIAKIRMSFIAFVNKTTLRSLLLLFSLSSPMFPAFFFLLLSNTCSMIQHANQNADET